MQKKLFFRLGVALALSASCWFATELYYQKSQKKTVDHGDAKPIAYVSEIAEDVERRPVTRIVWHLLSKGDPVYPGEMIKTSDLGEATIQFADSSRFLNLEPDSLIVLSQNANNEISLDLMDGNIYVGQGKDVAVDDKVALTLKSGEKTVDLTQASAQLSKSKGQSIDIQVLQGKAKVNSDGQTLELDSKKSLGAIEILSPALDKPIFLNPENPEVVTFKWKGFPAGTSVQLWVGKNRKALKYSGVSSDTDTLAAKIPQGKHFWKLVAVEKGTILEKAESSVFRTEVVARYSPAITSPVADGQVTLPDAAAPTEFTWNRPDQARGSYIEIAKDSSLKNNIVKLNLPTERTYSHVLAPGVYFWRVSASYPDTTKMIPSKVIKFTVALETKKAEPLKQKITIGWQDSEKTSQFFITEPALSLAWNSDQRDQVKSWRLKIADTEEHLTNPGASEFVKSIDTLKLEAKTTVAKPGRYIAMVEALDDKNEVLATSQPKALDVVPLPLSAGPTFQPATGELKANNQGRLDLTWSKVDGAKEYWLTLSDKTGKEIRKAKFNGSSTALVNLLPGEYKVSVYAIDQHGRETEKNESRSVLVPSGSGLSAPKFKKVKVD